MRPNLIQRYLRSRSIISALRTFKRLALVAFIAGTLASLAPPTIGCPVMTPDESAQIALPLGGGMSPTIQLSLYRYGGPESKERSSFCDAFAEIPLSAFPSTSNRFGTSEIASAIREQVDAWEVDQCRVTLYYKNDTKVDFAEYELCSHGTYGFEKGNFWSKDRENFCWEPVEAEVYVEEVYVEEIELEGVETEGETEIEEY